MLAAATLQTADVQHRCVVCRGPPGHPDAVGACLSGLLQSLLPRWTWSRMMLPVSKLRQPRPTAGMSKRNLSKSLLLSATLSMPMNLSPDGHPTDGVVQEVCLGVTESSS